MMGGGAGGRGRTARDIMRGGRLENEEGHDGRRGEEEEGHDGTRD